MIYLDERNQLNMGLFNVKLQDAYFYEIVQEDSVITINKNNKTIQIEEHSEAFSYQQSEIEETLIESGGVLPLYSRLGRKVFRHITLPKVKGARRKPNGSSSSTMGETNSSIEW